MSRIQRDPRIPPPAVPRLRRALLVPLLLLGGACVAEPRPEEGGDATVGWGLAPQPLAVIGEADLPAHVLGRVRGGLLLPDGGIVVADGMSNEIRWFAGDGAHRATRGGTGGGPGEFRRLNAIGHGPEGGVCAWDIQIVRVTCFGRDGTLVSTANPDLMSAVQIRPAFAGFFPDGSLVLQDGLDMMGMREVAEGERRDSVRYLHWDPSGRFAGVIASAAGEEGYFYNRDGNWGIRTILFGRKTVHHLDAGLLVLATNDSFQVRLHDAAGIRVNEISRGMTGLPADESRIARAKAEYLKEQEAAWERRWANVRMDAPSAARIDRVRREVAEGVSHRDTLPAFDEVRHDHAGRVWVGEPRDPDALARRWTISGTDLDATARIDLPATAEILDVGEDRILLLFRDELDVETVRLYRLEAPE